jgi:prepilin-type processing-associated H-X9-DG protein
MVELLVVLGIIALLMSLLLPAITNARAQAKCVACQSNLRQIGANLLIYANAWNGWIYPPEMVATNPEEARWPVSVFKPAVWNPAIMLCPADFEPALDHSYVLNYHIYLREIRYQSKMDGVTPSDVVVMGEKRSDRIDYYMTTGEFDDVVEPYRHGPRRGSNYLFLDLHVGILLRDQAIDAIDPWDVVVTTSNPGDGK